jgi:hypothetical protein
MLRSLIKGRSSWPALSDLAIYASASTPLTRGTLGEWPQGFQHQLHQRFITTPTTHQAGQRAQQDEGELIKHVLYRGRGMRVFRLLVRTKVVQLSGVGATALLLLGMSQGTVSSLELGVAGALVIGSGVASGALWYYSRRYVGKCC